MKTTRPKIKRLTTKILFSRCVNLTQLKSLSIFLKKQFTETLDKYSQIQWNKKLKCKKIANIQRFSRFNSDNPASTTGTEVLIVGLAIFKNGIHPSWEDPANHKAGEL